MCVYHSQYSTNSSHSSSSKKQHQRGNSGGGGSVSDQYQFVIVFMTNSLSEKYQWMSMLCYAQHKFKIDRLLQIMNEEQNKLHSLPIPPDGYMFDAPDTPETILFELSNNATTSEPMITINPYVSSEGLSIKAATLLKLVERLTHHFYLHPSLSHTFLLFFREFCSTKELLRLLVQRYNVPNLNIAQLYANASSSSFNISRYVRFNV